MPLLAVATTTLQWAGVLIPTGAILVGALGVYAAFHPHQQERREREQQIQDHLVKGENAINLIYGLKANETRGQLPQKGILTQLEEQHRELDRIKQVLGIDGQTPPRSIFQMLEKAEDERNATRAQVEAVARYLRRIGTGQDPRDEP